MTVSSGQGALSLAVGDLRKGRLAVVGKRQ